MTSTERAESQRTWAETHKPSRLEAANERGYNPEPSHPAPAHLQLDDAWSDALRASVAEAEAIRERALLAEERDAEWWEGWR